MVGDAVEGAVGSASGEGACPASARDCWELISRS
jgi:hypothetical protein